MESIRQVQKRYCSRAIFLAIIVGLGFILAGYKPIAKGLILGTLFSIVNFILMGETLPRRIGPSRKKATVISAGFILVRYALLAVPVFLGIRSPEFNLPAVIVGIFMVQLTVLGDHVVRLKPFFSKK